MKERGPPVLDRPFRSQRLFNGKRGHFRDDPLEIVGAHRVQVGVRRRVHEVDRIGDTVFDGEELVFTTWHTSVKARNIGRDDRIALLVEDEVPPYAYVIVRGRAALRDDMDELRRWARDLAARYMGANKAEEYGRRNAVPGELVVRVTPDRIVGVTRVAD